MELNQINKFLNPPLKLLQTFPLQGSDEQSRRRYLRDQIRTCIEDSYEFSMTKQESERLNDLSQTPFFKNFNISISHTKELGGFAITDKQHLCGLDIERKERITKPVVSRISQASELDQLGENFAHLWTLKEAGFKCLAHNQSLKLVVELQFSDFQVFPGGFLSAHNIVANGLSIQGVSALSFTDGRFIFGLLTKNNLTLV